jgi:hypothetical protein
MGAMNSLATVGLQLATAQRAQAKREKLAGQDEARAAEDLLARSAEAKRENESVLRRRLAEERARAGGAGLGVTGGSVDAVLRGLSEQSDLDQKTADQALERRLASLFDANSTRRRKSLLDKNTRWLETGTRTLSALSGTGRNLLG